MAALTDPVILAQYRGVLSNWNYEGYVLWKETAQEWVLRHLQPLTTKQLAQLMHQYVESGGEIDQVPEQRPEWNIYPFHYDLRLPIGNRLIYVETILLDDEPDDPTIKVVSIHDA